MVFMMMFQDRRDAGQRLASDLIESDNTDVIVYALPRGGVVVGDEVTRALNAPLTVMVARKIGHPAFEEYAIGAVTEHGEPMLNETEISRIDPAWLDQAITRERAEAHRRRETYISEDILSAHGKTAIIIDDGVATGYTLDAAINDIKTHKPKELVVGVPVAPADTARRIEVRVDRFVAVLREESFRGAVGAYYQEFDQTTDEEVIDILRAYQ
jgi:predicted phosphoribosyltransferase